jgi:hypothetical protein
MSMELLKPDVLKGLKYVLLSIRTAVMLLCCSFRSLFTVKTVRMRVDLF